MKNYCKVLLAFAAFTLNAGTLRAENGYSFDITRVAKKVSAEKQQKRGVDLSKEEWVYTVTVENRSTKDVPNVEIKYILFSKPQNASEVGYNKQQFVRKQGVSKVPLLKNFGKYSFDTEAIERTSIQLKPGYVWRSGSGNRQSKDTMSGLWIRIFSNGQQVMDYVDPVSLKDREKWESK